MVKCVPSKIYMELLDKMEGRNVPVNLNKTENEILNLIIKNNNITHIEIANALKITDKTAKRNTKKLKEKGIIERIGPDKTGYWKILYNKKC